VIIKNLNELEELKLDDVDYEELQNQLSIQENAGMISENVGQILKISSGRNRNSFIFNEAKQNFLKFPKFQPVLQNLMKDLKPLLLN
jgi:DNA repair protein RecN (Recombination protein N)